MQIRQTLMVSLAALLTSLTAVAQHGTDLWIGRSAAGQLKVSPSGFKPAHRYAPLGAVQGPFLYGWSDDIPGFDRVVSAEPAADVLPMQSGAAISLELLSVDPALRAIDGAFQILDAPGESTYLGGSSLHTHIIWHINDQDPAFDANQCVWHFTAFLRDDGATGYADSSPFTVAFTNVAWGPGHTPPLFATGDFNADGHVNLEDANALVVCLHGPGQTPAPDDPAITTCEVECLNAFDFGDSLDEVDLDVDLADVAQFQTLFAP